jgi:hypothetical protein
MTRAFVADKDTDLSVAGVWHEHGVGLSVPVSNGGLSLLSSVLLGDRNTENVVEDTSSFDAVTSTKFDVVPGALEDDGIPTCSKATRLVLCGARDT